MSIVGKTKSKKVGSSRRAAATAESPSDWRGVVLARVRKLIAQAIPGVVEEIKWRKPSNGMAGVPVWSQGGIICTGETYKNAVKLTFAKGAALPDPANLFNASLDGNARRAIDIHEEEEIDARAFRALVRAAAELNSGGGGAKAAKAAGTPARKTASRATAQTQAPKLLSGGNPQIAKADGDAPVQAYIAAIPGWKREIGRRLNALIERVVPGVRKAVKWNSPFYGIEGEGWFLAFHVYARFVKVTFFRGASLEPPVTGGKGRDARWIDIHEDDFDEAQLMRWVKQASKLPGWSGGR